MKKHFFIPVTLIACFMADAQTTVFPETFPVSPGVTSVTVRSDYLCYKPLKKDQLTAKYFFDRAGNHSTSVFFCDNKPCGRMLYYYQNGQMTAYKNYSSFADDDASEWDSTALSGETTFQYSNGRITGVRFDATGSGSFLTEINYTYDTNGMLIKEQSSSYYDSLGADLSTIRIPVKGIKEYMYSDTITTVKYFRDNKYSATETITRTKAGKLLKTELKSAGGKMLRRMLYKYNEKMQLSEISAADTGYDGFGNPRDTEGWDKTVFLYDQSGRLSARQYFTKGTICAADRYRYDQ